MDEIIMTKLNQNKPLYANKMLLDSESLGGLSTEQEFRVEAERNRRFTMMSAARAGLTIQDPMLKAMLHSTGYGDSACPPEKFKLETFEVNSPTQRDGFESLIEPLSQEDFFSRQYRRRTHMLFRGPSDRFSHLIGWNDLTVLFRSGNFHEKQLGVVLANQVVRETDYLRDLRSAIGTSKYGRTELRKVNEQGLHFLLRNGASLIINAIGDVHDRLSCYFSTISNSLGSYASANLYISWRDAQAFRTHWDDHDVYVMQVYGSKIWNLYGETGEAPLPKDSVPNVQAPTKPMWTGRLESGDLLFIPRGCWHDAIVPEDRAGQASMHLTITFKEFHSSDVLDWLHCKMIQEWGGARLNVPRNASPDLAKEYFRELRQALAEAIDDDSAEDFDDYIRSRWREETKVHIGPWIEPWSDPQWDRYRLSLRGVQQASIKSDGQNGTFKLTAQGRTSTFDSRCLSIIQRLFDSSGISVEELKAFDPESYNAKFMDQFLTQLLKQDIVVAELPENY